MRTVVTVKSERSVVESIKCDICGKISKGWDWSTSAFEVGRTEVTMKTGEQYPECGHGKEIELDICPDCFITKLVPFVEGFGTKVEVKEWDN